MEKIKKMKFVIILTLLLCINNYAKASGDPVWYEDREEAFTLAKEEGKYVLLLYGRPGCGNCQAAKQYIREAPLNAIVLENFILWFCDHDIPEKRAQGREYREQYPGTFPLLCVIDPDDPMPPLSHSVDRKTANEIAAILNAHLPNANGFFVNSPNKAYIAGHTLVISNSDMNETIRIYTVSGQLIDSFDKKDRTTARSAHSYPGGILLVNSSSGWNLKIRN
jgi:DNA polymerase III delta prime subunit